ncbi:MAG: hopanoid biosynthesis-associated protein HpnK [Planctomycetes bacterium]|nr:hopanoid biosynthesis-associated protein HpnK [Planctomycetota bacterium]
MKQLIVTADDFGKTASINEAIISAYTHGILTNTSFMMNSPILEDTVRLAKENPNLQVGMHVTLSEGKALAATTKAKCLVRSDHTFKTDLAKAGFAIHFSTKLQEQIRQEIIAQFNAFQNTGLKLKHVDCHHHFQIHPEIFSILLEESEKRGIRTIRIPNDPWHITGSLSPNHKIRNFFYRYVFSTLAKSAKAKTNKTTLKYADGTLGLYQTGEIHETWLLQLLDKIPDGIFELYTHPDKDNQEYKALISPKVREKINELYIHLIPYSKI